MKRLYRLNKEEFLLLLRIALFPEIRLPSGKLFINRERELRAYWRHIAGIHGFLWYTVEVGPGEALQEFLAEPIKENKNERD